LVGSAFFELEDVQGVGFLAVGPVAEAGLLPTSVATTKKHELI
jgi:hypothetical protein